jgi:hypothetical protein
MPGFPVRPKYPLYDPAKHTADELELQAQRECRGRFVPPFAIGGPYRCMPSEKVFAEMRRRIVNRAWGGERNG